MCIYAYCPTYDTQDAHLLHTNIYQSAGESAVILRTVIHINPLSIYTLHRCLELHYPYYPSEKDFTHSILSSSDTTHNDIVLLSHFSLQWQRLQAGGKLLPDLIEFYQWLHANLAHVVSYEMACKVKIKNIIDRAVRKYSTDMGEHLHQLFTRVKGEWYHVTIYMIVLLRAYYYPVHHQRHCVWISILFWSETLLYHGHCLHIYKYRWFHNQT